MTKLKSEIWRGPFARGFDADSVVLLENIGEQLQSTLAPVVAEPLTPELHDLLHKLAEAKRRK
ncbi:MAG: hypothetical protein AB7F41_00885 [Methylocystis sp.]|uniref:hypothetical protein n=1 Tax=Methylocystis sp. TaxID=1911079 RepID=UPI003D0E0CD1